MLQGSETSSPGLGNHAGRHLILEVWQAVRTENPEHCQRALESAASASGATVLRTEMHDFGHGAGVTGVTLLAESHITIHTWPEYGYAALDVFTCGAADPYAAIPMLAEAFRTDAIHVVEHVRGTGMLSTGAERATDREARPL